MSRGKTAVGLISFGCVSASPCGSPPPFGERFVQKIVWLMWPPPLNFRAGWRATWAVTSPEIEVTYTQVNQEAVMTAKITITNSNFGITDVR